MLSTKSCFRNAMVLTTLFSGGTPCCQQSVADFFVSGDAMLLRKWAFFFLEARHVVNKVLLISLFQRRHAVTKMGLLFCRHVMLSTKCC